MARAIMTHAEIAGYILARPAQIPVFEAAGWVVDTDYIPPPPPGSAHVTHDELDAALAARVASVAAGDSSITVGGTGENPTVAVALVPRLLAWAYAQAFRLTTATRDSNEAITTASVVWPDASTGTFTTDTASTAFPGAIDAYHITYVPASGPTKTVTQTAVTRDSGGAVVAQPALTVT